MKTKKLLLYILGTVLVVGGLGYGILRYFGLGQDLSVYVPSNALFVARADVKSIVKKFDIKRIQELNIYKDLIAAMPKADGPGKQAMSDPTSTGIGLLGDLLVFGVAENDNPSRMSGGVLFSIADKDKFASFLTSMDKDGELQLGDFSSFRTARIADQKGIVLMWNNSVGLFYINDNSRSENSDRWTSTQEAAAQILSQSKDNSIRAEKSYRESQNTPGDLSFYINGKSFRGIINRSGMGSYSSQLEQLEGASGHLLFEPERISMKFRSYNDGTVKENIVADGGLPSDYCTRISSSGKTLGVCSINLDLSYLFTMIEKLGLGSNGLEEVAAQLGITVGELKSLFTGKMVLALTGIEEKELQLPPGMDPGPELPKETVPVFSVQMGTANKVTASKVINRINAMVGGTADPTGTFYSMKVPGGVEMNLVQQDDRVIITNDAQAGALANNGKWSTLNDGEIKDLITDNPFAFYWDLNVKNYGSAAVKKLDLDEPVLDALSILKNLEMKATHNGESDIILNLSKGDGSNSLFRIVQLADRLYAQSKAKEAAEDDYQNSVGSDEEESDPSTYDESAVDSTLAAPAE